MPAAWPAASAACLWLLAGGSRVATRGLANRSIGAGARAPSAAAGSNASLAESNRHLATAAHRGEAAGGSSQTAAEAIAGASRRSTADDHRKTAHQSAVDARRAAAGSSAGATDGDAEARVRRLVQQLIADDGGHHEDLCWIQNGDRMGCKADCPCGAVLEQCFPKFVSEVDSGSPGHHRLEDIGVCGTAVPTLIFLSWALFVCLLCSIVIARIILQWREAPVEEAGESLDRPKESLLLPSSSRSKCPPVEKADDHGRKQAAAWAEAEGVTG